MALLEVKKISKHFGGLAVLRDVDFSVNASEIVGLIGPNGAGKTTLFNVMSGFLRPSRGNVIFNGEDITGIRPDLLARKGVVRTFQLPITYMRSTVFDNVLAAFHMSYQEPPWKAFLRTGPAREEDRIAKQNAMEIMEFTGLAPQKDKLADSLSSGYHKLLAISIAFATNPKLLLLDEPVVTLSPDKVEMIMGLVNKMRHKGTTVIIIEHNMKAIMDYCDRIVVLGYGKKIAEGPGQEIQQNKEVIEAYLGDMASVS